jgi:hypothetical protein
MTHNEPMMGPQWAPQPRTSEDCIQRATLYIWTAQMTRNISTSSEISVDLDPLIQDTDALLFLLSFAARVHSYS